MSRRAHLVRFIRHWHARIGVAAALFFLLLALTGVALNHTGALRLDARPVAMPWLMHWYGLHGQAPNQGYLFEQGYVAGSEQRWVMDGRLLTEIAEPVIGTVEVAGLRYVASASALYIYQTDGMLVDKLSGSALPVSPLSRIGQRGAAVLVEGQQGVFASEDGLSWQASQLQAVSWSQLQPLPDDVHQKITPLFTPSLPLERVLLDVHSGRIFGHYGPLAMDLVALAFMLLSLSGIWIYWRSIHKRH